MVCPSVFVWCCFWLHAYDYPRRDMGKRTTGQGWHALFAVTGRRDIEVVQRAACRLQLGTDEWNSMYSCLYVCVQVRRRDGCRYTRPH
jgi:hypothetical protein